LDDPVLPELIGNLHAWQNFTYVAVKRNGLPGLQVPSPQDKIAHIFCLLFSCSQKCPIFRLNRCTKKKLKSGHLAIVNQLELLLLWMF